MKSGEAIGVLEHERKWYEAAFRLAQQTRAQGAQERYAQVIGAIDRAIDALMRDSSSGGPAFKRPVRAL